MIVYVDVMVAENFIIDLFLLTVTAQSINIKPNTKRMLIASLIAALYTLTILFKWLYFMKNIVFIVGVAALVNYIAFGIKKISFIVKATFIYMVYGLILCAIVIYAELKQNGPVSFYANGLTIHYFHYGKQLLTIMIIYIFVSRIVSVLIDKQKEKSYIYDVQVVTNNKTKTFKALLDTGNELKEPVTDLPVMLVENNIFSEGDYDFSKTFDIPYCSVGNSKSILKAFKPDSVKVRIGRRYYCKTALIAVYNKKFSDIDQYQALLSRHMI